MKMKEMVKNLIAKVKENKIKSGIITGLLVMTLVGGTATAMLMSDNTAKADNDKTITVAKTVKKSNAKKVEKEVKENKESKPEEVKEAEKKLEEAKKSGNVEAIKEAEKFVETKKSAVKATASSNSTSKQSASTSKQTASVSNSSNNSSNSTSKQSASTSKQTASVSNSSNNSSKSSSEASKPAAPQKKKVWVVTKPAWDEQVPDYNLPIYKKVEVYRFYNGAGQLIYTIVDNSEDVKAKAKELTKTVNGLSLEAGYEDVPTGEYQTKTIHHEAEGEYVWQ